MHDENFSTVSELVGSIKNLLEGEFKNVSLIGEVSNFSPSSAGHFYFTLSDSKSSVSCAIFKFDALRNPYLRKLKNGDKVVLSGPVSVYSPRGTFQVIGKRILPFGKGDLNAQFEVLKNKLRSQGLFDQEYKKKIPKMPKRIAVITALKGAALQDFLNIIKRRSIWHDVLIFPAIVQGNDCPKSVIKGLKQANKIDNIEVIVVTRGGGSIEDLWGFNDEALSKEIFNSKIPVISAVGHQTDFTLVDYVSDLRLETPSAAAEYLTEYQMQVLNKTSLLGQRLKSFIIGLNLSLEKRLSKINPSQFKHLIESKIKDYSIKLERIGPKSLESNLKLDDYSLRLNSSIDNIEKYIKQRLKDDNNKIQHLNTLLVSLDPKNVLNRGYAFLETKNGLLLTDTIEFDKLDEDEIVKIHLKDGNRKVKKV